MKKFMLGATVAVAVMCHGAKADTVTFDVSATLDFPTATLGGNIVIDPVAGTVVSVDITVMNTLPAGPFTTNPTVLSENSGTITLLDMLDARPSELLLYLPVSNLVGYTGGQMCSFFSLNCPGFPSFVGFATGQQLAVVAGSLTPTPLPSALPLFATGLGALGLLGWRRKRKAQAAA